MKIEKGKIILSEVDLKEIFRLFSSPTEHEEKKIYQKRSDHYYEKINIEDEYEVTQSKKEFVIDAWRSILYFLYSKGFNLTKNGEIIDLSFMEDEFA